MIINPKHAALGSAGDLGNSMFVGVHTAKPGHRFYSPSLGRFINKDPSEEQGGLNLYGFCGNNGVNLVDYLGNDPLTPINIGGGKTLWVGGDPTNDHGRIGITPGGVYDVQPDHGVIYGVAGTGPSILAANEHFANTGSSQGTNSPSGSNVAYSLPTLVVHGTSGDNLGELINHAANDQYGHGAVIGGPTNTWALAYPSTAVDNFMAGTGGAVAGNLLQGTAYFAAPATYAATTYSNAVHAVADGLAADGFVDPVMANGAANVAVFFGPQLAAGGISFSLRLANAVSEDLMIGQSFEGIAGTSMTGWTRHGLNQSISRDNGLGVSNRAIFDALRNPEEIVSGPGGVTQYIGPDANVILNKNGKMITTVPTTSSGTRTGQANVSVKTN